MVVDRVRADHRHAELGTDRGGFGVEVVQDLDVIADEPGGHDDRGIELAAGFRSRIQSPMSGPSQGSSGRPLRL